MQGSSDPTSETRLFHLQWTATFMLSVPDSSEKLKVKLKTGEHVPSNKNQRINLVIKLKS